MEQEYPPAVISASGVPTLISGPISANKINAWNASLTGQPYGNGAYVIRGSSAYSLVHHTYMVFDALTNPGAAHWKGQNYRDGEWNITAQPRFTLDGSYYGDWVTIQLPVAIPLASCAFVAREFFLIRAPHKFRIYGSRDGIKWVMLHDQTTPLQYASVSGITVGNVTIAPSAATYSHFGLVVSAIGPGGPILNFARWRIYARVRADG